MYVIFDLDGTLADGKHREWLISDDGAALRVAKFGNPKKLWDAYFDRCDADDSIFPIIETWNALAAEHCLEIWSGRSDRVRDKTVQWLLDHGISSVDFRALRMRPEGDFTEDSALKERWLHEFRDGHGYLPDLAFVGRVREAEPVHSEVPRRDLAAADPVPPPHVHHPLPVVEREVGEIPVTIPKLMEPALLECAVLGEVAFRAHPQGSKVNT